MAVRKPMDLGKRIHEEVHSPDNGELHIKYGIYLKEGTLVGFCEEYALRIEDSDIRSLRRKMQAAIDEKVEIKWERWLLIRVDEFVPETGNIVKRGRGSIQFEMDVEQWEFTTHDGVKYSRALGETRYREGWPEGHERRKTCDKSIGRDVHGHDWGTVAVIRDTPEAREALIRIEVAMNSVTRKLVDFLAPSNINKTLQKVLASGNVLALPAPKGK